jgi:chromosome partitioning protein
MAAAVVTIAADKGGVGKSTTARNVAAEAARRGQRVLAIDADKQADLTGLFAVESEIGRGLQVILDQGPTPDAADHLIRDVRPGIDLIPAHPNLYLADRHLLQRSRREYVLQDALETVCDDYDLVLIDLGHSDQVMRNAFAIADLLLVPTTTSRLDAVHIGNMLHEAMAIRKELRLPMLGPGRRSIVSVWQRPSGRTRGAEETLVEIREHYSEMLAPRVIRTVTYVDQASNEGLSVREYYDHRALASERSALRPVLEAYEALAICVLERVPAKAVA